MSAVRIQDPDSKVQHTTSVRAGGTIAKGSVVKIDPTDTTDFAEVVVLGTSELVGRGVGVALADAVDGDELLICYRGVCDVLVDGTADVSIGDLLVASAGTAGELIKDGTPAVADVNQFVSPLEAQATDDGTLTKCFVRF